jgi:hypothetical protein
VSCRDRGGEEGSRQVASRQELRGRGDDNVRGGDRGVDGDDNGLGRRGDHDGAVDGDDRRRGHYGHDTAVGGFGDRSDDSLRGCDGRDGGGNEIGIGDGGVAGSGRAGDEGGRRGRGRKGEDKELEWIHC